MSRAAMTALCGTPAFISVGQERWWWSLCSQKRSDLVMARKEQF